MVLYLIFHLSIAQPALPLYLSIDSQGTDSHAWWVPQDTHTAQVVASMRCSLTFTFLKDSFPSILYFYLLAFTLYLQKLCQLYPCQIVSLTDPHACHVLQGICTSPPATTWMACSILFTHHEERHITILISLACSLSRSPRKTDILSSLIVSKRVAQQGTWTMEVLRLDMIHHTQELRESVSEDSICGPDTWMIFWSYWVDDSSPRLLSWMISLVARYLGSFTTHVNY